MKNDVCEKIEPEQYISNHLPQYLCDELEIIFVYSHGYNFNFDYWLWRVGVLLGKFKNVNSKIVFPCIYIYISPAK